MLLEVFFSFFLKKDVFPHFVLFFCCCCLLSMASDLRVFWCPCATACLKYISRKKKNNRGGKKVGRTLFCIFGLKSQLSGKQSSDCLVCLWNTFSFSSVTHTHISVWEHVCVCCLAQWQKLPAVRLSRTVCYASLVLGPPHFNSPVTSWLWQLWCHSRGFEQGRYQKSRRK